MVCSQHVSHLKVYERTVLMLNFEKKNILVKSLKLYSFCFCLVRWWIFTFNQNRYDGQMENTEGYYINEIPPSVDQWENTYVYTHHI